VNDARPEGPGLLANRPLTWLPAVSSYLTYPRMCSDKGSMASAFRNRAPSNGKRGDHSHRNTPNSCALNARRDRAEDPPARTRRVDRVPHWMNDHAALHTCRARRPHCGIGDNCGYRCPPAGPSHERPSSDVVVQVPQKRRTGVVPRRQAGASSVRSCARHRASARRRRQATEMRALATSARASTEHDLGHERPTPSHQLRERPGTADRTGGSVHARHKRTVRCLMRRSDQEGWDSRRPASSS
jgi:hypothetical protein